MDKLDFINLDLAMIFGYLFYGLVVITHVFIITKIIPYTYVNGGRSTSYQAQVSLSKASIIIAAFGILFFSLNHFFPLLHQSLIYALIAFILTAYWLFGFVLQWLGTPFEKFIMSWIALLGVVSHLMLGLLRFIKP